MRYQIDEAKSVKYDAQQRVGINMDVIRGLIENTVSIMSHFDTAKLLSDYQIDEALGLSPEDYADTSEVEFE